MRYPTRASKLRSNANGDDGAKWYTSSMAVTVRVMATAPAIERMEMGITNSPVGKLTLSFCDSLNRNDRFSMSGSVPSTT